MGLLETMAPTVAAGDDPEFLWPAGPVSFHVTVMAHGHVLARTVFHRAAEAAGVSVHQESLKANGFLGQWWLPPSGTAPHPGILIFGGSEGGISQPLVAAALASAGYPTLDIAYFDAPGLPDSLHEIPLEYFAGALRWLGRQPEVQPGKLVVLSASRGSEAALLLGVHYPDLVHGVIALSPSDAVHGSFPVPDASAWTYRGRPIPYVLDSSLTETPNDPAATIPVQDIHGPIFLACGEQDYVQDSCGYSRNMQRTLTATHDRHTHVLSVFPQGGHDVDGLIAYEPLGATLQIAEGRGQGATPLANDQADARLWPRLLSFLATAR